MARYERRRGESHDCPAIIGISTSPLANSTAASIRATIEELGTMAYSNYPGREHRCS